MQRYTKLLLTLLTMLLTTEAIAQSNVFPASGNVGIGTVTPANKLDVLGNSHSTLGGRTIIGDDGNYNPVLRNYRWTGGANLYYPSTITTVGDEYGRTNLRFLLGSMAPLGTESLTPIMTLLETGSVGIGTTSPETKLDIVGDLRARGSVIAYNSSYEGGRLQIVNSQKTGATTYDWSIWNMTGPYGDGLAFWRYFANGENAGPLLWLGDSGNVGIGTRNPSHKLAVNGTIKAKELLIETNGWPDYVFSHNYPLPRLADIEAHIREKGHLPGIPSAEEVAARGINVGEMHKLLLQKIEELTLHMIELKNENLDLRRRMDGLQRSPVPQ